MDHYEGEEFLAMDQPLEDFHFAEDQSLSPSSDRNPVDTLFAEFSRSRPRLQARSPYSYPLANARPLPLSQHNKMQPPKIDLRALEYVSDFDSQLMCAICHVPFIDPVSLECDHTFCSSCFEEFRTTSSDDAARRCPTCRSFDLRGPRRASRLISNMCNDVKTRCPNDECDVVMARSAIELHATRECPEELLNCPAENCQLFTRRKNRDSWSCRHKTHIECECGALVELGKGDWLKHKDEDCPKSKIECEMCHESIPVKTYVSGSDKHICEEPKQLCAGADFGCNMKGTAEEMEDHEPTCQLAKVAPYLQTQSRLLSEMQEQLLQSRARNEAYESAFDRLNDLITHQVMPKLDTFPGPDIEEIPRLPQQELLLPAHLRELTPSPGPDAASQQQHLLALHESLRGSVSTLEADMGLLAASLADLDARTSMQLMNETLRIKEDLAHTNAALFSSRAQIQWLLNRERIVGQHMAFRGRPPPPAPSAGAGTASSSSSAAAAVPAPTASGSGATGGMDEASSAVPPPLQPGSSASASASSAAASPLARPTRRLSSGSQERVKL